jgi:hypothetical protein
MIVITLPQPGQVGRHIGVGHLSQVGPAGGRQHVRVPGQVPAVRRQRVGGQAAFDQQMVQVAADGGGEPGTALATLRAQARTSSAGT